ncbi:MAG: hypothetical protein IJF40_04720, partial [Clostridia bacterium]|nr:hypothetical protein [Clostridia bacterium]
NAIPLSECPYEPKGQGFESLAARQLKDTDFSVSFNFFNQQGIRKPVKKTVRWTVFRAWTHCKVKER